MKVVLAKANRSHFKKLRGNRDFTDGFLLHAGTLSNGWALQRYLMELGLTVKPPGTHPKPGYYWFGLSGKPYNI